MEKAQDACTQLTLGEAAAAQRRVALGLGAVKGLLTAPCRCGHVYSSLQLDAGSTLRLLSVWPASFSVTHARTDFNPPRHPALHGAARPPGVSIVQLYSLMHSLNLS